jgi:hypothetical protein
MRGQARQVSVVATIDSRANCKAALEKYLTCVNKTAKIAIVVKYLLMYT